MLGLEPAYLGTRLPAGPGDPVLVLYLLEWGRKSLAEGLAGFWDAPFYFPATAVMTFADHLLGPAAQGAFFRLLWDDGVAAYDFLFLGSFVLSGLTTAWVLRQAGASRPAALIAGLMFAFSPYRFDQKPHLQVLLMQWVPLVLWLWHRLLVKPSWQRAAAFGGAYLLHVTGGNYLAYLMHPALAILLGLHWRRRRALVSRRSLAVLAPTIVICAALTWSLFHPYLETHRGVGLERATDEIRFYGATLRSWISIERDNRLWGRWLRQGGGPEHGRRPENDLFVGFVTLGFAVTGAAATLGRRRARDRGHEAPERDPGTELELSLWRRGVIAIGVFFFLLTFAWFHLALSRLLPGLSSMRVPTRAHPFVSFALAALAAGGVDALLARVRPRWPRTLAAAAIGAVLLFELRSEVPWRPWPRREDEVAIFHEIAGRPEVLAVLHLPILNGAREAHYMYHSMIGWKPIANGYSGFAPASYLELERRVREQSLEESTLDYLLALGISHVATHPRLLQAERGRRWLESWERRWTEGPLPRIRLVATAGNDRLYQLLPGSGAQ